MNNRGWKGPVLAGLLIAVASVAPLWAQETSQQTAEWIDFQQKAAAWRALPEKPRLSEEVQRERVSAENALRQKDLRLAVDHYEAALKIDPVWPVGHFNAALIYSQLQEYQRAIWHMRCYLELVPHASDAKAARDRLRFWEGKIKEEEAAAPTITMTYGQALEQIRTSFQRAQSRWGREQGTFTVGFIYTFDQSSVKLDPEAVAWSYNYVCSDKRYMEINPNIFKRYDQRIDFNNSLVYLVRYDKGDRAYRVYDTTNGYKWFGWGPGFGTEQDAQAFADALNSVRAYVTGKAGWQDFPQKAAAWRALPSKPPIPEEARRHRLLAEHAYQNREFFEALLEFEAGLDIYPTWPEGQFNAAITCGELKGFHVALRHMQAYLELVPDAADAQSARDQMIIWEGETNKAQ